MKKRRWPRRAPRMVQLLGDSTVWLNLEAGVTFADGWRHGTSAVIISTAELRALDAVVRAARRARDNSIGLRMGEEDFGALGAALERYERGKR